MKYTSHLEQLSVDMFRSSFDELDKHNCWVKNALSAQARESIDPIASEPSFQKQQNVGQECATLPRT